ncbi:MAG: response regulator, partial [Bacteroidota bacterium]
IEDDNKVASAIGKHLKAAGYTFDIASDGVAGEDLAFVNQYDVILLDVMLPKQDGWTTCVQLRRHKVDTPILMLTALDDVEAKVRGLDSGADDYLAKPFHFPELLARIRSLARRGTPVRSSIIEKYGLRLELNSHRAFRDGKEISLTAKEFALLELFLTRSDTVLSREVISEHLWGMDYEQRSNVIESFVKFLRQKIDRGSEQPLIHTIRGAGYIFSDTRP